MHTEVFPMVEPGQCRKHDWHRAFAPVDDASAEAYFGLNPIGFNDLNQPDPWPLGGFSHYFRCSSCGKFSSRRRNGKTMAIYDEDCVKYWGLQEYYDRWTERRNLTVFPD